MAVRSSRFIGSALVALILCGGTLIYGLGWGVPQWNGVFQGELGPVISAYGGWALSIGVVMVGVLLVGGCVALSWARATFDFLLMALGIVAAVTFIALGLPGQLVEQIDATLSFVIVGLCALLVAKVFFSALKDRLSRRYRA